MTLQPSALRFVVEVPMRLSKLRPGVVAKALRRVEAWIGVQGYRCTGSSRHVDAPRALLLHHINVESLIAMPRVAEARQSFGGIVVTGPHAASERS